MMTVALLVIAMSGWAQVEQGLGSALAAELNPCPGPRHVLDLERDLSLAESQIEAVTRIFEEMNERARAVGHRVVAAERELNERFESRSASGSEVHGLVVSIGALERVGWPEHARRSRRDVLGGSG